MRKEKQRLAEIEKAYSDRLVELNKEMNEYHDQQRRFYRYNYPDRLTTFRIVRNARLEVEKEERTLRSESRLWERRVTDEDFGHGDVLDRIKAYGLFLDVALVVVMVDAFIDECFGGFGAGIEIDEFMLPDLALDDGLAESDALATVFE